MATPVDQIPLEEGGSVTPPSQPAAPNQPTIPSEPTQAGSGTDTVVQPVTGAVDYTHPALKGKTPQEVEETVRALEAVNRDYAARLDQTRQSAAAAQPSAPPPPKATPEEFFSDPQTVMERTLEKMVAPLRQELQTARRQLEAPSEREELRKQFKRFGPLETVVDQVLRNQNVDPTTATKAQLTAAYYLANGYALENGIVVEAPVAPTPAPQPPAPPVQPPAPPQHRPSSAPLPESQAPKNIGEPTEEEAWVMRKYGFKNYAEYRAWQGLNPEEVVDSNIGREGK